MNAEQATALEDVTRQRLLHRAAMGTYAASVRVTDVSVELDDHRAIVRLWFVDDRYPDERFGAQWTVPEAMETDFEGGLDPRWIADHVAAALGELTLAGSPPLERTADQQGTRWHRGTLLF